MADKVAKGDFVQIDYVGRIKETGKVFDLTKEEVAKSENIFQEGTEYRPVTIVVGAGHVLNGLDDALATMEMGAEQKVEVAPDQAFGLRDKNKTKVVGMKQFKKRNISPYPGMRVNFEGEVGTVVSASSGRVIVDFNHPFAGKTLVYEVKILKKIDSVEEKTKALIERHVGVKPDEFKVSEKGEDLDISITNSELSVPGNAKKVISDEIFKYLSKKKVRYVEIFEKEDEDKPEEKIEEKKSE